MPNFDYSRTIFPMLIADKCTDTAPIVGEYIGTCFYSTLENYPIIFTAKHVLESYRQELVDQKKDIYIATRFGRKPAIKLEGAIIDHKSIDFGAFVLAGNTVSDSISELNAIPIEHSDLQLGTDVFTIGYPNSHGVYDDPIGLKVPNIYTFCFKGFIISYGDDVPQGGTRKTYMLNFPGMSGLSGAPLMLLREERFACAGILIGNRTIRTGEEVHNFAIALDASPLLELKDIISNYKANRE